jgi:outer membrane lipoprotein-sorting protein
MKPFPFLLILCAFIPAAQLPTHAQDHPDATEVIRKAEEHLRGETSRAQMKMTIERPEWSRTIEMKTWSKGNDYSMVLITAPARDEGTAYLMRDDEVWNWLPQVEKVVKIPPSMMSQSWMGSDFSNDDLVKEFSILEDYTHTILGDSTIQGYDTWKVELMPKEEAAVVWGKVLLWVSKEDHMQMRAVYFNEQGQVQNIMKMRNVETMGGRKIPSKMIMEPADEEGKRTILEYRSLEFNVPIRDSFFSQRNMKRLRG